MATCSISKMRFIRLMRLSGSNVQPGKAGQYHFGILHHWDLPRVRSTIWMSTWRSRDDDTHLPISFRQLQFMLQYRWLAAYRGKTASRHSCCRAAAILIEGHLASTMQSAHTRGRTNTWQKMLVRILKDGYLILTRIRSGPRNDLQLLPNQASLGTSDAPAQHVCRSRLYSLLYNKISSLSSHPHVWCGLLSSSSSRISRDISGSSSATWFRSWKTSKETTITCHSISIHQIYELMSRHWSSNLAFGTQKLCIGCGPMREARVIS